MIIEYCNDNGNVIRYQNINDCFFCFKKDETETINGNRIRKSVVCMMCHEWYCDKCFTGLSSGNLNITEIKRVYSCSNECNNRI